MTVCEDGTETVWFHLRKLCQVFQAKTIDGIKNIEHRSVTDGSLLRSDVLIRNPVELVMWIEVHYA